MGFQHVGKGPVVSSQDCSCENSWPGIEPHYPDPDGDTLARIRKQFLVKDCLSAKLRVGWGVSALSVRDRFPRTVCRT
jgi:hypothetical protein